MFNQIIVGCDSGPGTRDAVSLASSLAQLSDESTLTLVHAYPPSPTLFGRRGKAEELDHALHGEGMRLLEQVAQTVPDSLSDRVELLSLPVASPAYAIHDLAAGRGADLIVIGPAQHGTLGRLLLGSESTNIIHGAPCPVAIPPSSQDGSHEADLTRDIAAIAVGYDGSSVSSEAVDFAAELATSSDRPLEIIGVVEMAAWPAGLSDASLVNQKAPSLEAMVREALEIRISQLPQATRARPNVVRGTPSEVLSELSSELHLMVIGSRDYGPLRHILLGSTSRAVLDNARCPVIVVPRTIEDLAA